MLAMVIARKGVVAVVALASLLLYGVAYADTASELNISRDGTFSAKNLTVMQKGGTNLFTRATWGTAFIRITVLAATSTDIKKNHGEKITIADVKEGELLDVDGRISAASESIIVSATRIRNVSQERESKTVSGIVRNVNRTELSFVLPNRKFGPTKVILSASTPIKKGARQIQFDDVFEGDTVLSTSGIYDYTGNTLSASSMEVYQDRNIFEPRNFEGILKSMSGTILPATLVVAAHGKDYTVYLSARSSVLKNNKAPASLVRFVAGDTVRFYGGIRETNLGEVDAEIVRDMNF